MGLPSFVVLVFEEGADTFEEGAETLKLGRSSSEARTAALTDDSLSPSDCWNSLFVFSSDIAALSACSSRKATWPFVSRDTSFTVMP